MLPKLTKNSEPEDEQVLCRLDAKQKLSATTSRKRKTSPALPYTTWGFIWDLKSRDLSYNVLRFSWNLLCYKRTCAYNIEVL